MPVSETLRDRRVTSIGQLPDRPWSIVMSLHDDTYSRIVDCVHCAPTLDLFYDLMRNGDNATNAAARLDWDGMERLHRQVSAEPHPEEPEEIPTPSPPQPSSFNAAVVAEMTRQQRAATSLNNFSQRLWGTPRTTQPYPPNQAVRARREVAIENIPQWVYEALCAWHAYPGTDRSIINCSECGERLDRRFNASATPIVEQEFFRPVTRPMHNAPPNYWENCRTRHAQNNFVEQAERERADRAVRSGSQFKTVNNR